MDPDTAIGGPDARFPATRVSAVEALRSSDAVERTRGYESLVASYWKPVYKYIRIKWRKSNEDSKDLTQAFFARAIEKDLLLSFDPAKAAFRTFLRVCLDGFLANENQAAGRLKRGGDAVTEPLDFDAAEGELGRQPVSAELSGEEYFHREWRRHLFGLAVEQLRRECQADGKKVRMQLFERYDLEEGGSVTYEQLAAEFAISVSQVTNALAAARRDFRRILLELDADVAL
jgi:RNA polymerase sigma factor (sigma-70 family)